MKRALLWVALLLSVGFNLGVLATLVRDRAAPASVEQRDESAGPVTGGDEIAEDESGVREDGGAEGASEAAPDAAPAGARADQAPASPRPAATFPEIAREGEPPPVAGQRSPQQRAPVDLRLLVDRLGLQGEQRVAFVRLQQQLARHVRAMQPGIQRAQTELYRELAAPTPDRQRIDEHIAFLARSNAQLERAFADTALRTRELLDPEQEQTYLRFLSRRIRVARAAGDGLRPPAARRDGPGRPPAAPRRRP